MTIASEIERLQNVRTDIYDELGSKCVNLDGSSKYADVAPIIKKMPVVCAKIGANKYPVVKIGNQLWTAKNLDEDLGTIGTNEWYYNGRTEKTNVIQPIDGNTTISSSAVSDRLAFFNDWDTGVTASSSTQVKSNTKAGIAMNATISFSSPLVAEQQVQFRVARIVNGQINYTSKGASVSAGSSSYNFKEVVTGLSQNYDVRFVIIRCTANASNAGIVATWSNVKITYGASVPSTFTELRTDLANEATYKKYGRLYTWDNVNTNLASLGLQGWRTPTKADFDALVAIDGTGKKFRAKSFANGTDDYGFCDYGFGTKTKEGFSRLGTQSNFLGEDFRSSDNKTITLQNNNQGLKSNVWVSSAFGGSVRLVCDLNEDGSIPDGAVIIAEADESAVATLSEDGVAVASVEPSTDSES